MSGPPLWGRDNLVHPDGGGAAYHSANLSMPYLCGLCWTVLGLDLEEGLGAKRGPAHQGRVGCPWLCRKEWVWLRGLLRLWAEPRWGSDAEAAMGTR